MKGIRKFNNFRLVTDLTSASFLFSGFHSATALANQAYVYLYIIIKAKDMHVIDARE